MISEQSIEWAKRHLLKFGGSDVFPPNEDYKALSANWEEIKAHVQNIDLQTYVPKAPYLAFANKADGTYRAVHELDPIDSLIITAAIYELSSEIESYRIPADRRCAFSYRIHPDTDGSFFSKNTENWANFKDRRNELLKEFKEGSVLIGDISDFYNQIYLHRVRNALDEATSSDKKELCIFIEKFLKLQNYKISQGVPVGPAFSVVLAELVLNDLDRKIVNSGLKFVRWVDDIFVFSKELRDIKTLLHDLSAFLYGTHRLVFNGKKTKILSVPKFNELLEGEEDSYVNHEFETLKETRCNEIYEEVIEEIDPYDYSDVDESAVYDEAIERFEQNEKFHTICETYRNILERAISIENYILIKHVLRKTRILRIKFVEDIVYSNLIKLQPNIRDVAHYIVSTSRSDTVEKYTKDILQFMRNIESAHSKRWLAYILSVSAFKSISIDEKDYLLFDIRDRAKISIARSDVVRIKEFRNSYDIIGPWDRREVILSFQKLSADERNPLLSVIESKGDILEKNMCKYVRGIT